MFTALSPSQTLAQIADTVAYVTNLDTKRGQAATHVESLAENLDVKVLDDADLVTLVGLVWSPRAMTEIRERADLPFGSGMMRHSSSGRADTVGPSLKTDEVALDPFACAAAVVAFKRRFGQPGKSMRVTVDDVDILVLTTENVRTLTDALVLAGHRAEDEATR